MSKFDEIRVDMFNAMAAKNINKRVVLKSVINYAQAIAKESHTDVTDEVVIQALNKEIKQLNQSIDSVNNYPESKLYIESIEKKTIIESYLPRMMDKSEIRRYILTVIDELGITDAKKSDKGQIMKVLMPRIQGKADGKLVNEMLEMFLV